METKLFPKLTYQEIAPIIEKTPFLNLEWHFKTNLNALKMQVDEVSPSVATGVDFQTYKANLLKSNSLLAREFDDDLELGLYVDYVVGLTIEDVDHTKLLKVYDMLSNLINDTLVAGEAHTLFADEILISNILSPVFKWKKHHVLLETPENIISKIEDIIAKVQSAIEGPSYYPNLIDFQNHLIFCYLVILDNLGIGVHAKILSSHLFISRRVNSVKWASTPSSTRLQYSTLLLHLLLRFFKPEEVFHTCSGFSINVFADLRAMLDEAAGATVAIPFTSHQWVFRWFKDKIDAEVFSLRGVIKKTTSLGVLSDTEQCLAVELCRRFGSYRVPVTIDHMEQFLLQFGTTQRIRGALRLLNHVKFYPLWELAAAVEKQLAAELGSDKSLQLVIAPFGEQTGSTAIVNYLASHSALANQLKHVQDIPSALAETKDGDSIYFVDDCLLSGTQSLNILKDLMGTRERKPHHTNHAKELCADDKKKLLCRSLRFMYSIVTDLGVERFHNDIADTGIVGAETRLLYSVMEHSTSKAFEPLGPVSWASAEERDEMKCFCSEVGYKILAGRSQEKGWNEERRNESALGFSDFQRLLVFPYNVPKTTVTLLWEQGSNEFPWIPLFYGFD